MTAHLSLITLLCLLLSGFVSFCRSFQVTELPEISNIVLEKNKPILLQKNHTKIRIKDLNGTLYLNSFSQLVGVVKIAISNSQIRDIEDGAICSLSSLRAFELNFVSNYNAPVLKRNTFKNCEKLENLSLIFDYDRPSRINIDVFRGLVGLKELVIKHLNIGYLTKEMFKNLKQLERLDLFNCHIDFVDSDAFEDLISLQELKIIYSDKLNRLPPGLFRKTSKLTKLILTNNNIADLTWDEFEGLSSLRVLVLVQNQLKHFDAVKIAKNMPNLKELNIELNPLPCRQKEAFVNELKAKFGHSIRVTYKYDPGFFDSCEQD